MISTVQKGWGFFMTKKKKEKDTREDLLDVLGMRLYDIQNALGEQIMKNGKKKDYISYESLNGFNNKWYKVTVCMEEVKKE